VELDKTQIADGVAAEKGTGVRRGHCAMAPPQTLKIKKCIKSIRQWR